MRDTTCQARRHETLARLEHEKRPSPAALSLTGMSSVEEAKAPKFFFLSGPQICGSDVCVWQAACVALRMSAIAGVSVFADTVYAATEVCRAANPNNESLQFDHQRTVCERVREGAVTDPALEIGARVRHYSRWAHI